MFLRAASQPHDWRPGVQSYLTNDMRQNRIKGKYYN